MRLRDLLAATAGRPELRDHQAFGSVDVELARAVHDSRQVAPGDLFCCVPGATFDGHDLAADAVAAGAVALVTERRLDLGVPEVVVTSVRTAMGPIAAELLGRPSDHLDVVGITGTNGKTTTTHLLAAILRSAGRRCALIGTLSGTRTTPEAPELQTLLASYRDEGYDSVAMEVSSHALDQHRVDGTRFRVAAFTNLSRDHLDHHGDMVTYFQAKARLFEPDLCDRAVVDVDDPHGRLLRDAASVPSTGYGLDDADDLVLGAEGSTFTWRGERLEVGLAGRFNVSNALAAATIAAELGVSPAQVAVGLRAAAQVPGRFERIEQGQPFLAVVDYAHTPDGLEQLLVTARELAHGHRVLVVFGAGGDRDHSKRPVMGELASQLADVVIVTTDNPRSESPAAIISDVLSGTEDPNDLRVEPDRRAAIALAVGEARPGDVVLVAGKGHETHQLIGTESVPFDDRHELRAALAGAGWTPEGEVTR